MLKEKEFDVFAYLDNHLNNTVYKNEYFNNENTNQENFVFLKNAENNEENLKNLQKKYGIIFYKGQTRVIEKDNEKDFFMVKFNDFYDLYRNLNEIKKGPKGANIKINAVNEFFESDNTDKYNDVIFNPNKKESKHTINLFKGLNKNIHKKLNRIVKDEEVSSFVELINSLSGFDENNSKYFKHWLAHMFQKMGERPGVNIFLYGTQGIGKGILMKILRMLLEPYYLHLSNDLPFSGQFNSCLANKILIFLDEAVFSGDVKVANKLKGFTTEDTYMINGKYAMDYNIENFARIIGASNNENIVSVEKGERRNVVFNSSDKYKGSTNKGGFFYELLEFIKDENNVNLIYNWLIQRDISDFRVKDIPQTKAMANVAKLNFKLFDKYLIDVFNGEYEFEVGTFIDNEKEIRINQTVFYDEYIKYVKKLKPSNFESETKTMFTKKLKEIFDFPDNFNDNWKTKKNDVWVKFYKFDKTDYKQKLAKYLQLSPENIFYKY